MRLSIAARATAPKRDVPPFVTTNYTELSARNEHHEAQEPDARACVRERGLAGNLVFREPIRETGKGGSCVNWRVCINVSTESLSTCFRRPARPARPT
jgi:hypothetical protein